MTLFGNGDAIQAAAKLRQQTPAARASHVTDAVAIAKEVNDLSAENLRLVKKKQNEKKHLEVFIEKLRMKVEEAGENASVPDKADVRTRG